MIFTGGKIFKSFSDQKSFSFAGDFYFYNTSGAHSLRLNTTTGTFGNIFGENSFINFYSGKILDFKNRRLFSYNKEEPVYISGDICSGKYSLYVNNNPIIFDEQVCSTCLSNAVFDKIIITGNSTLDFSLDLKIQEFPLASLYLEKNLYSTGENVKLFLKNESNEIWRNFKIYSGEVLFENNTNYNPNFQGLTGINIKPNDSGFFLLEYDNTTQPSFNFNQEGQIQNINGAVNFETNFGSYSKPFSIPIYLLDSSYYSLDFYNTYSGVSSGDKILWSFDIERKSCSGSRYSIGINKGTWYNQSGFDQLVYLETGTVINNEISNAYAITGNQNFINITGFLPASGCGENEPVYIVRHNIFYTIENEYNRNTISYIISGLDENFLFSGLLET